MKKFYESPVVELTGFSAEDVITTSVAVIPANEVTAENFSAALGTQYNQGTLVNMVTGEKTSYNW